MDRREIGEIFAGLERGDHEERKGENEVAMKEEERGRGGEREPPWGRNEKQTSKRTNCGPVGWPIRAKNGPDKT